MKDTVDGLMAWLMFQSGLTVTFWHWAWYAIFYGRALVPAIRMFDLASWQAWELAIAHQLDLPILRVIVDGDPSQLDGESIQCQSDSLESDYRTKVVPELKEASRTALRLGGPLLMMGLVAVISTVLIVVIIAVVIVTVLALALYLNGRTLG